MTQIIAVVISGIFSLAAAIVAAMAASRSVAKNTEVQIKVSQAVTDTKIEELTREVREHNNFAQRVPSVETKIEELERRTRELEKYHRGV